MKNKIHTTIMGGLTLFSAYLYLLAQEPLTQQIIIKDDPLVDILKERKEAFEYLNRLRIGAGLIPLSDNKILEQAAQNHAQYLIDNNLIGHYEDSNKSGFTGIYGSDRSLYAGYQTSLVIENISNNNFTYKESVDGLMAAIYHRFGFLDFHTDEIGIGVSQNQNIRSQTAFVYDMSSHELEELCKKKYKIASGEYVNNICADKEIKIRATLFSKRMDENRERNNKVVTYPFSEQEGIPPAFYDELPDPLPQHQVSGFPISISFNESYFKQVEMLSFELFDSQERKIEETIVYDHITDINKKLKKFEYALFPLKRLLWDSQYTVKATYKVDGKIDEKVWKFKTKKFNIPVYEINKSPQHIKIKRDEPIILYFPPRSPKETLGSLTYPATLDISFIDKNTIKLVANNSDYKRVELNIMDFILIFDIKE